MVAKPARLPFSTGAARVKEEETLKRKVPQNWSRNGVYCRKENLIHNQPPILPSLSMVICNRFFFGWTQLQCLRREIHDTTRPVLCPCRVVFWDLLRNFPKAREVRCRVACWWRCQTGLVVPRRVATRWGVHEMGLVVGAWGESCVVQVVWAQWQQGEEGACCSLFFFFQNHFLYRQTKLAWSGMMFGICVAVGCSMATLSVHVAVASRGSCHRQQLRSRRFRGASHLGGGNCWLLAVLEHGAPVPHVHGAGHLTYQCWKCCWKRITITCTNWNIICLFTNLFRHAILVFEVRNQFVLLIADQQYASATLANRYPWWLMPKLCSLFSQLRCSLKIPSTGSLLELSWLWYSCYGTG